MKSTGIILAVFMLALVALPILLGSAGMMHYGSMPYGMMSQFMRGMMYGDAAPVTFFQIVMMVVWVLVFSAIVILALWLVRNIGVGALTMLGGPTQILKERYARGEITKEQFDEMKKELAA